MGEDADRRYRLPRSCELGFRRTKTGKIAKKMLEDLVIRIFYTCRMQPIFRNTAAEYLNGRRIIMLLSGAACLIGTA